MLHEITHSVPGTVRGSYSKSDTAEPNRSLTPIFDPWCRANQTRSAQWRGRVVLKGNRPSFPHFPSGR